MQIISSYGVEIKKQNIPLRHTLDIFRFIGKTASGALLN